MEVEGWIARVVAMHASSPLSYGHFQKRNRQLDELANYLAKDGTATIRTAALIDPSRACPKSHPRLTTRTAIHSSSISMAPVRGWLFNSVPRLGPLP